MEKEKTLNNISSKFEKIDNIIVSMKKDLDLLNLEYTNTYKEYLNILSNNIDVYNELIIKQIENELKDKDEK